MKTLLCLLVLVWAFTSFSAVAKNNRSNSRNAEPRCTYQKMWVDYDVTENEQKGMRLHVKFTAYDMMNMDAYVAVYFEYNDERGGLLKDKNGKFNSTNGEVALYRSIKPAYNPSVFENLELFMPYSELDLAAGTYDLTMDLKIIYKTGGVLSKLTFYDFEYTQPDKALSGSPVTSAIPTATIENLWTDFNITENGVKGMRIHIKCTLLNLKNVDCYLAVYFEKKNGEKLYGTSTAYRSKSGQAAVYKSLRPAYNEAVYDDAQLFMPYSEFNVGAGKTDLKLDADVIYNNGDMLKHLKHYEFWFEQ